MSIEQKIIRNLELEVYSLQRLLTEARADIFEEIQSRYPLHSREMPTNMRRYQRDMDIVRRIDAALAENKS